MTTTFWTTPLFLLNQLAIDPLKTERIKTLAMEIYKTINSINPNYVKEIFKMNESQNSQEGALSS